MKAISLWQPWASAMALGSKTMETRSWSTDIRGTVAIHAAKRCVKDELIHLSAYWNWCGALGIQMSEGTPLWELLPFGSIVAVGDLVACIHTNNLTQARLDTLRRPEGSKVGSLYEWNERMLGDYSLGRYAWCFENVRRLKTPIPFKGSQGFFNLPDELFQEVEYA